MSLAILNAQEAMRLMSVVGDELAAVATSLAAIRLDSWEGSAGDGARAAVSALCAQASRAEASVRLASAALAEEVRFLEAVEAETCWRAAVATMDPFLIALGSGSGTGAAGGGGRGSGG
ncbi:MAG: hypothetical protein SPF88_08860 [Schaalia hyovaginalis]|uniref:hypothetical protein n=1 Tax=Schaalia hyovaginalis TaxID=29316 RepID=UPI002A91FF5E|nr:hypothetical protein [Schaalia hyovaginalis]MDY5601887.1 hypothetical protein [Schaalia hyovaginalis]